VPVRVPFAFEIACKIVREPGVRAGSPSGLNGSVFGGVRVAFGKGPEPNPIYVGPIPSWDPVNIAKHE